MDRVWSNQVRATLAALRDPVRRHERRLRRLRRALVVRSVLTIGLAWVTSVVGAAPGVELGEVFWAVVTGCAGASALAAARRVWLAERAPRPVRPAAAPPLPPVGSVARAPMERLASRERALADLLGLLGAGAGTVAADAAAAARTLREHAARVVAVESARQGVPAEAATSVDTALGALRQRLEEGVSGYERLVAAAADAVAASGAAAGGVADGTGTGALYRLEDAVDTLTGLARGLRAVTGGGSG